MLRNTGLVLAGVLLIAFYCRVAYLVLNPRVSDYYRAYYIDKTTTISKKMLEGLQDYQPGTRVSHLGDGQILFERWASPEAEFRWSNAREVHMLFRLKPPHCVKGVIHLNANVIPGHHVTVIVNGTQVDKFVGEGGDRQRDIPFAPELADCDGLNRLTFLLPDANIRSLRDRRKLSVALKSIAIE